MCNFTAADVGIYCLSHGSADHAWLAIALTGRYESSMKGSVPAREATLAL